VLILNWEIICDIQIWIRGIIIIPDNATKSLVERPTALNIEVSVLRLEDGAGMAVLAADWLAVLASLLPSFTFQVGPPSYHEK
jgi:hypothetical protein